MRAWFLVLLFMVVGYVGVFLPVPAGSTGGVLVYRFVNPDGVFYASVVVVFDGAPTDGFYRLYFGPWVLNVSVSADGVMAWIPWLPPGTSYFYLVPADSNSVIPSGGLLTVHAEYVGSMDSVRSISVNGVVYYGGFNDTFQIMGSGRLRIDVDVPVGTGLPATIAAPLELFNASYPYAYDDAGNVLAADKGFHNVFVKLERAGSYTIYVEDDPLHHVSGAIVYMDTDFDTWSYRQSGASFTHEVTTAQFVTPPYALKISRTSAYGTSYAEYYKSIYLDGGDYTVYVYMKDSRTGTPTGYYNQRFLVDSTVIAGVDPGANDAAWHQYVKNITLSGGTHTFAARFQCLKNSGSYGMAMFWDDVVITYTTLRGVYTASLEVPDIDLSGFVFVRGYYLLTNNTVVETNYYTGLPEDTHLYSITIRDPSSTGGGDAGEDYNDDASGPDVYYERTYVGGQLVYTALINITLWGGDEFYGSSRSVRGYIETRSVDNNWVNLGSYDSVLIQYYSPGATAGFYEGGNYVVVGYLVQAGENIDILGARYIVDASGSLQNIKYVYSSVTRQYYPSNAHYAKLVFYKGNVLALINLGGNWYRVEAKHNSTSVSYLVFTGDGLPANVTIMRGDYLRFRGDNLVSVEFTGFDGLGNTVHFSVGDNSPGDVDTETGSIMVQELPYLYPLRGNLTFYYRGTGLSFNYTFPRIERGQWVNVSWGNLSLRNVGNSTLVNAVLDILRHPYGRIILGLLPVLLMLYPNRKYGAIMGLFAVALLGFFNIVAITNGLDPVIDPRALVLSFIVLAFGLLYEVK